METSIFEQIQQKCLSKNVVSLCKKLLKRCSLKSPNDCQHLCELAYWLYVHDNKSLALDCIELTMDLEFNSDYRIWDSIHTMWGLKIRLLREQGKHNEAQKLIDTIDSHNHIPSGVFDTPEKQATFIEKLRSRVDYNSISYLEKIAKCQQEADTRYETRWKRAALQKMISYIEKAFYPQLNERKQEIESKIAEYIANLSKVK
jgi:hypothetical protein